MIGTFAPAVNRFFHFLRVKILKKFTLDVLIPGGEYGQRLGRKEKQRRQVGQGHQIMHKWVERSNTDMIGEMVRMMSTQRALQSAGQMLKIYDQVMNHATNDLGRM